MIMRKAVILNFGSCKPVCFSGKSRRRRAQEKDKWTRIDELLQG